MTQLIIIVLLLISFIFGGAKLLRAAGRPSGFGGESGYSEVMSAGQESYKKIPRPRGKLKPLPIVQPLYGIEPPSEIIEPIEPPVAQPLYGIEPGPIDEIKAELIEKGSDKRKNDKTEHRPRGWDKGKKVGWKENDTPPGLEKEHPNEPPIVISILPLEPGEEPIDEDQIFPIIANEPDEPQIFPIIANEPDEPPIMPILPLEPEQEGRI